MLLIITCLSFLVVGSLGGYLTMPEARMVHYNRPRIEVREGRSKYQELLQHVVL